MSQEQLQAFLEAVKKDAALQLKLKAANGADDVILIAKESGFLFSDEDLRVVQSSISEQELEGVAGGTLTPALAVPIPSLNPVLC